MIGTFVPTPVPASIIEAIQSIEVINTDEGQDGFQITFSIGRSGSSQVDDYPLVENSLLKPFNRIIIITNFGITSKVLIDGIITHHQLNPSNDPGKSTLTITGEDLSVMMDMHELSITWPNLPTFAIINLILLEYAQYGLIPMVIPPLVVDVPLAVLKTPYQKDTDLNYVRQIAQSYNYVFYIEPTDTPGINTAYWGPLIKVGIPQKALSVNMGPSTNVLSINFQNNSLKPTMVLGTVQDRESGITIPVITLASSQPPLSSQPAWLANLPNVKNKLLDSGGMTILEAYVKAQAETDSTMDVVTASGQIDTLVYGDVLKARNLVGLRGVGFSYDGLYYVKSVTHQIKRGEYKQSFTLTREGTGSLVSGVQI